LDRFTPRDLGILVEIVIRRRLKNGVHSVVDLQAGINRFIKEHNEEPKPFRWKADLTTSSQP
jgi:hypothetical protein